MNQTQVSISNTIKDAISEGENFDLTCEVTKIGSFRSYLCVLNTCNSLPVFLSATLSFACCQKLQLQNQKNNQLWIRCANNNFVNIPNFTRCIESGNHIHVSKIPQISFKVCLSQLQIIAPIHHVCIQYRKHYGAHDLSQLSNKRSPLSYRKTLAADNLPR